MTDRPARYTVRWDRKTKRWTCTCGESGDLQDGGGAHRHKTPTKEKR